MEFALPEKLLLGVSTAAIQIEGGIDRELYEKYVAKEECNIR